MRFSIQNSNSKTIILGYSSKFLVPQRLDQLDLENDVSENCYLEIGAVMVTEYETAQPHNRP
jgi:hypothetical protein